MRSAVAAETGRPLTYRQQRHADGNKQKATNRVLPCPTSRDVSQARLARFHGNPGWHQTRRTAAYDLPETHAQVGPGANDVSYLKPHHPRRSERPTKIRHR